MDEVAGHVLEAVVGEGAMGTVYRARQQSSLDRVVAIKRLRAHGNPEQVSRLRREADVLARLDHPHVMRIHELVEDGDGVAIVMQFAPGGSLADLLAVRGRLTASEVAAIAVPIADALASAHRQGVLHRDVKPANILFTSDGEPLLSDFGTARWTAQAPSTAPGMAWGTPEYADPSTADGADADERSDVYSLGVVCYEALTGQRPYRATSPLGLLRALDKGRPVPLADLAPGTPPVLAAAIERAIARSPADRFHGAAQFAAALRAAADTGSPAAAPVLPRAGRAGELGSAARAADPAADPPTRLFGPRPVLDEEEPEHRRVPWVAVGSVALLLLLAPVTAGTLARKAQPQPTPSGERPAVVCSASGVPAPVQGETIVEGDLDGSGCLSWVRWRDNLLIVPQPEGEPLHYELGAPGDVLVLGDWNCDGTDTPGLYRPSTGEVFLFESWAASGEPVRSSSAVETGTKGGLPQVVRQDGCDTIVVAQSPPSS